MNGTAEIVAALKRRPCTYAEMMFPDPLGQLGRLASLSPQKRVAEWLQTAEGQKWRLVKGRRWRGGSKYLVTWALKRRPK